MTLITPRATEKAYAAQSKNTYIFSVPASMTKQLVASEVSEQFKVTVTGVRITNRNGKATKFRRGRHAYPGTTYKKDKKYAYVTLKAGDRIKVFDEEPVTAEKSEAEKTTKLKAADEKQDENTKKTGFFAKRRTGRRGDK